MKCNLYIPLLRGVGFSRWVRYMPKKKQKNRTLITPIYRIIAEPGEYLAPMGKRIGREGI